MRNEIVEEILTYHTLERIMNALELTEYEVLDALIDSGLITYEDLSGLLSYDEED